MEVCTHIQHGAIHSQCQSVVPPEVFLRALRLPSHSHHSGGAAATCHCVVAPHWPAPAARLVTLTSSFKARVQPNTSYSY